MMNIIQGRTPKFFQEDLKDIFGLVWNRSNIFLAGIGLQIGLSMTNDVILGRVIAGALFVAVILMMHNHHPQGNVIESD